MSEQPEDYTEDCCFNDVQDHCDKRRTGKCPCRCHMTDKPRQASEQEMLLEIQRCHRLLRDSDTARIRMNHRRIAAEEQLATERARAEAAEGREARYRAALLVAERNTTDELIGHGSNLLRMCRVCDQAGEQGHIPHAPDCPFAALAGTTEDLPSTTPRESHTATIRVTEVKRGEPTVYPDEVTAFACGGGTHVVAAGEAVCQCGENRMELLL